MKALQRLAESPYDENPSCPDLGLPDDGIGLDLRGLHYGNGALEGCLCWGHGRLGHRQSGLALDQPVEILFHRLDCCHQL